MVKVTYEPLKEVIIKETTYFKEIKDLAFIVAGFRAQGIPISLNWANGIVFFYIEVVPETAPIAKEFIEGKVYWANVSFSVMPKYKSSIDTKEKIQVPIINQNSNPTMKDVTEWLKQQVEL